MKIVFAGSPRFAIPTLERLADGEHQILAVFTQPDRPSGREQQLQPSPVKEAALQLGLPIHQPEKIKSPEVRAVMEGLQPEVIVVVGYGQIVPPWLLALPRYGCVNLHASLLPAYRGAAPIQWAVVHGETRTGLTTMLMDAGLDTGPILLQHETEIGAEETAVALSERMSAAGPELMMETLRGLAAGTLVPQPQDDSRASRAPLLHKENGLIDWKLPASGIFNRVRGFLPWPGTFTKFRGQKLQIWQAKPGGSVTGETASPGQLRVEGENLQVACGDGASLYLLQVQLEGKRRISAAEFIRGARLGAAEMFEFGI